MTNTNRIALPVLAERARLAGSPALRAAVLRAEQREIRRARSAARATR